MEDIILVCERSQTTFSIKKSKDSLAELSNHLLFLHSFSGCDTTSATFMKGKVSWFNKIKTSKLMKDASNIMTHCDSNKKDVEEAAINCFKVMYGGNLDQTLSTNRY